jgi:hypothetical protein
MILLILLLIFGHRRQSLLFLLSSILLPPLPSSLFFLPPTSNKGDEQALERNLPFEFLCLLLLFLSRARDVSQRISMPRYVIFSFLYIHCYFVKVDHVHSCANDSTSSLHRQQLTPKSAALLFKVSFLTSSRPER